MTLNFFEKLKKLESESTDSILEARAKKKFEPNYQFPYHAGIIDNVHLTEAIYKSSEGYKEKQNFIDPCCGDGFPLILANKAGCNAYGLEIEKSLVDIANENIKKAKELDLINLEHQMLVTSGDMFNLYFYEHLGKNFEEFDIFYLYALKSKEQLFLKQFSENAKKGARIIIVPGVKEKREEYILNKFKILEPLPKNKQSKEGTYSIYKKI